MNLADGTDLRQVTVLSKADWERIQKQLYRKQMEEERVKRIREENEDQMRRAKEMTKDWSNTITVCSLVAVKCCILSLYFQISSTSL